MFGHYSCSEGLVDSWVVKYGSAPIAERGRIADHVILSIRSLLYPNPHTKTSLMTCYKLLTTLGVGIDSLRYLPITESMVITFLAPTLACWVCATLLHEPFTRKEQIAGAIALIGVILIARPLSLFDNDTPSIPSPPIVETRIPLSKLSNSTNQIPHLPTKRLLKSVKTTPAQRLGAVSIALLGVLGAVISYVTIRMIGACAHALISVNYFSICTALVSLLAILLLPSQIPFRLPSNSHEWFLLLFLGVCGFVQQLLFTKGLQCDEKSGSRATHMVYTHIIFALVFDRVFWGSIRPLASLLGGGMILGSAIWVALVKTSEQQQERGKDEEEGISLRLIPVSDGD